MRGHSNLHPKSPFPTFTPSKPYLPNGTVQRVLYSLFILSILILVSD